MTGKALAAPAAAPATMRVPAIHLPPLQHGEPSLRRIAWLSLLTIVLGIGGLTGWAAVARLDSAVPATGVIVSAGKRKTISLLDGGILKQLAVAEGDHVRAGQMLLRLDDAQARATLDQAAAAYWGAVAAAARLQAEAMDQRDFAFPADLREAARDPAIAAQMEAERHSFEARNAAFEGAERVGRRRIAQLEATATALTAQIHEVDIRIGLYETELRGSQELLAKGFATKFHVLELQRSVAELRGGRSDLAGRLAETRQEVAQAELEIINAAQSRRTDITKDRSAAQATMADAGARMRAARDTLDKHDVRAPQDGIVTDIKFLTPGSAIGAGQPIMDLVPLGDGLLVEANVAPTDIENVHVGQKVNVRLSAYKAHQVPVVTGRLVYVGADRQTDAQDNPFFLVRARLDDDALAGLHDVALYPGMPADVLVLGGERTALDYLISPIRDSIRHGMTEK